MLCYVMLCYTYCSPTLTVINIHECANANLLYCANRTKRFVNGKKTNQKEKPLSSPESVKAVRWEVFLEKVSFEFRVERVGVN